MSFPNPHSPSNSNSALHYDRAPAALSTVASRPPSSISTSPECHRSPSSLSTVVHRPSHGFNSSTTGNRSFAECNFLCQGLKVGHSAKSYFAECRTRQRYALPSVRHSLCRVSGTQQSETLSKDPFCRVSGTRQTLALGKKLRQVTAAACRPGLPSASR